MTPDQAKTLIPRKSKVYIDYPGNPGHGGHIKGVGVVTHIGTEVNKTLKGTEYVWVNVTYGGIMKSVFASHFLSKLS